MVKKSNTDVLVLKLADEVVALRSEARKRNQESRSLSESVESLKRKVGKLKKKCKKRKRENSDLTNTISRMRENINEWQKCVTQSVKNMKGVLDMAVALFKYH